MFYGNYGYSGYVPMPNNPMMGTSPNQISDMMNGASYQANQFYDLTERVNRLERQVKRLDQRLVRLETPYANNTTNIYNNEPDNNMYMM